MKIQHYRKIQQSTVTPCGNTTFPILSNFIIDDNYKCCNEFLLITLDDAIAIEKNTVRQFDSQEWIDHAATSYGIANEVKAKEEYTDKFTSRYLHDCELVVIQVLAI